MAAFTSVAQSPLAETNTPSNRPPKPNQLEGKLLSGNYHFLVVLPAWGGGYLLERDTPAAANSAGASHTHSLRSSPMIRKKLILSGALDAVMFAGGFCHRPAPCR